MNETDAKTEYADIISLPHPRSNKRSHMSLYDRAAQFAPFAALSGYDDMVVEEARLTEAELSLSEERKEELDRKMLFLFDELAARRRPRVRLTHFVPDSLKSGGRYAVTTGLLKTINMNTRTVTLYGSDDIDNRTIPPVEIPIDRITSIETTASP